MLKQLLDHICKSTRRGALKRRSSIWPFIDAGACARSYLWIEKGGDPKKTIEHLLEQIIDNQCLSIWLVIFVNRKGGDPLVCMYICMNVCMYTCMYVCMWVCMHVNMYAHMYACMYMHKGITYRERVAVCCSVLQCVAVCCSVLQCVAVHAPEKTRLSSFLQTQVSRSLFGDRAVLEYPATIP